MNRWISSINNAEHMKEWIHDLWIFALLKKFAPMYLVSRWIYEKRVKLLKGAIGNLWSAMVTLILCWFLLYFLLGWSMSYCTVLERCRLSYFVWDQLRAVFGVDKVIVYFWCFSGLLTFLMPPFHWLRMLLIYKRENSTRLLSYLNSRVDELIRPFLRGII